MKILAKILRIMLTFDEIAEMSHIKKFQNVYDSEVGDFVSINLLEGEVEESFNNRLVKLDQRDLHFKAKKKSHSKYEEV